MTLSLIVLRTINIYKEEKSMIYRISLEKHLALWMIRIIIVSKQVALPLILTIKLIQKELKIEIQL